MLHPHRDPHLHLSPRRGLVTTVLGALAWACLVVTSFVWLWRGWPSWHADASSWRTSSWRTGQAIRWGDQRSGAVALMFNVDWGQECLPDLLDTLKEHRAPATFFVTGTFAERFPDLVRNMAKDGHVVASHGQSHVHPAQLDAAGLRDHILEGISTLEHILGRPVPRLYAPPYGEAPPSVVEEAARLGLHTILWSVDSLDWQRPSPAELSHRVLGGVRPGALVLMHPTPPTLEALPEIIQGIRRAGWQLVTVPQILPPTASSDLPATLESVQGG
ncbi:MAG TPA: polysaccharide deacetylase family protein [Firmicutes bacterium]|nr:polysaccharide deacetylase family protein [Bacillota bacterium]